jgi:hypothetical protein
MAARSSGMPSTAVYLVSPRLIAAMAASLILSGVSKSVAASRFQIARLLRHCDGGRRLDAVQGMGQEIFRQRHDKPAQNYAFPYQPDAPPARVGFVIPVMSTF